MYSARHLLVVAAATAAFVASVLYAEAQTRSRLNDGPTENARLEPQSPIGTALGSANLWAVINTDGTIARSDGGNAATTTKLGGTGTYQVGFRRRVDVCAFSAVVGQPATGSTSGVADVATRAGNNNAVFVETRDFNGTLVDRPFHLVINC
jgi:hypothetical protein